MTYAGVEFSENGAIGLVHATWLTPLKKEVFWPPYKTSKAFDKALLLPEEPLTNTWTMCPIKRIYFECDDVEKAKKKLKKLEDTSDIYSTDQEYGIGRRNKVTKRFLSDSSSDENEPYSRLKRPPTFSKSQPLNDLIGDGSYRKKTGIRENHQSQNQLLSKVNGTCNTHGERESEIAPIIRESLASTSAPNTESKTISVPTGGLDKVFQEIKKIREDLKEIKVLLTQSRTSMTSNLPNDIPVAFPLTSIPSFLDLEEHLDLEGNRNTLASYLSSFGGNGTTAQVNKILRFLMKDVLATNFNFAGQRNRKEAFGSTKLNSVIVSAVQIKTPTTTRDQIENAIKIWLKHAKQRMQKRQRN